MGFGRTDLFLIAVPAIAATAGLTDLFWGRIYNWLTVPALVAGVAYAAVDGGWGGAGGALLGVGLGLALYGWMFWLRFLGGGDVKLLMALGAWGGVRFTGEVAALGILLGGVLALGMLVCSGRIASFARRMYRFGLSLFVKELEVELPRLDRSYRMPFGIPIALAAVWVAFGHPFGGLLP